MPEHADAEIDGFRQRQFFPLPQQRLLRPQRLGSAFEQRLDRVLDRVIETTGRRDLVDQAPGQRRRRVDVFRRHHQPARAAPADQPRQQRRVDHRGDADLDLGHAEMGVMRGDPEIAGGGNFQPAAKAPAGQPRDHGRRKFAHGFAEVAQPRDEGFRGFLVELGHFLDVGAADHALLALAGQDHRADGPIGGEFLKALAHAVGDGRVQNVERAGIADRQPHHAARITVDAAMGIEHFHRIFSDRSWCWFQRDGSRHFPDNAPDCQGRVRARCAATAGCQSCSAHYRNLRNWRGSSRNRCSFFRVQLLLYDCKHLIVTGSQCAIPRSTSRKPTRGS